MEDKQRIEKYFTDPEPCIGPKHSASLIGKTIKTIKATGDCLILYFTNGELLLVHQNHMADELIVDNEESH